MIIPTQNFQSVEMAAAWAAKNKPYEKAMEDFQNRDVYRKLYGERCCSLAQQCWEAANLGDKEALRRKQRELSYALPHHVFDYAPRKRER